MNFFLYFGLEIKVVDMFDGANDSNIGWMGTIAFRHACDIARVCIYNRSRLRSIKFGLNFD